MKLSVHFTPHALLPGAVAGKPVLIIDILRATTTMVTALAHGARAILPAPSAEEALRIAHDLERDDLLLAGERRAERIEGFALGNSPLEMTPEVVSGKTILMATTNGTPALVAAEAGRPVLVGAAVNFSATAAYARDAFHAQDELHIVCAGRERAFALEDAYTAGRFARAVLGERPGQEVELNDAALASFELVRHYGDKWRRALGLSAAARALTALGFKADIAAASEPDRFAFVAIYADRHVTIAKPT